MPVILSKPLARQIVEDKRLHWLAPRELATYGIEDAEDMSLFLSANTDYGMYVFGPAIRNLFVNKCWSSGKFYLPNVQRQLKSLKWSRSYTGEGGKEYSSNKTYTSSQGAINPTMCVPSAHKMMPINYDKSNFKFTAGHQLDFMWQSGRFAFSMTALGLAMSKLIYLKPTYMFCISPSWFSYQIQQDINDGYKIINPSLWTHSQLGLKSDDERLVFDVAQQK